MNAKQIATEFADSILALIPELIHQAVEERRKHACWWELYYRRRLELCRRIMRPWWRSRVRKASAQCAANKAMALACAMASVQHRMGARA